MNHRAVWVLVAGMQVVLALGMIASSSVGFYDGDYKDAYALLLTGAIGAVVFAIPVLSFRARLRSLGERPDVHRREGLAAVGFGWIVSCMFGALPFLVAGFLRNPADAIFETASGFTTTGASILTAEDFARLPRAIAMWRGMTHWLGGVGIVVILVSVLPTGGRSLFRSEVPGVDREAFLRRVQDSAMAALQVYVGLTVAEVLLLLAVGVGPFDAIVHSFATIATGGFSSHGASVGYFHSFPVELVIVVFMYLAGTNFGFYHTMLRGGFGRGLREMIHDPEWRFYSGIVALGTIGVGFLLWFQPAPIAGRDYSSLGSAMRDSLFSVVSVGTSTGFATANFDAWPELARLFLLGLIMTGACAGSTSGGIKLVRVRLLLEMAWTSVKRFTRPRAVHVVRLGNRPIDAQVQAGVVGFFLTWTVTLCAGVFVLVACGMTILEAIASAGTCLGNIGPALGRFGPASSFASLASFGKLTMALLMVLGRLEFYALFALLRPRFWSS